MGDVKIKVEKYSFSKLNTFIQCPFRYYLQYVKGHYIDTPNINAFFGTLIHYCEEQIGIALKNHEEIPYEKIKDEFLNINRPKKNKYDSGGNLFGINILKKMFPKEFFQINDKGQSFDTKAKEYLNFGIYRLEEYMKKNPNLSVYGTEMHFEVEYHGVILTGSIDRVLYDSENKKFIIEDIKTKDKFFSKEDATTPLQAVIYSYALKSIANLTDYPDTFQYDLPMIGEKQSAGTKGFIKRGLDKINKVLDQIHAMNVEPKPCPLCAWCTFSPTNPGQVEEAKNLCSYYSLWRPGTPSFVTHHVWEGLDKDEKIVAEEKERIEQIKNTDLSDLDF